MSKLKTTKNKIKSKLEVIKKFNDEAKPFDENSFDLLLKDLPSSDFIGKKVGDLTNSLKKKKEESGNIFGDLVGIVDSFLASGQKVKSQNPLETKSRIKQHANDSIDVTLQSSKQIVLDNVKKILFAGDGICGTNKNFTGTQFDTVRLKPKEFDFLNVLTVDPNSNVGKIVYEPSNTVTSKEKTNRELYTTFSGTQYRFDTSSNKTLFDMNWSSGDQEFILSGLTQGTSSVPVEDFLNDYYSSIELPDISGITKMAMLMTIQGDSSETPLFTGAFNDLNRLITKLCSVCGNPKKTNTLSNQNAIDLFNENDEDLELYFNFDDVEGIDLDDENARYRKVLRFQDCNNFEVPVNTDLFEDFVYLSGKKNLNDLVNSTLNKVASDSFEQSDGSSITLGDFQVSINNLFILNLPKALIMSVISPKIFLPIVVVYKLFKSVITSTANQLVETAKEFMKKFHKLFSAIIKDLFWKFISEFWKRVKVDLLNFVLKLAQKILKNKLKRYYGVIAILIALLTKILEQGFDNCYDLFNAVISTLTTAINTSIPLKIPPVLLLITPFLPGYSPERAYMAAIEGMSAAGIPTGPINGEPNDFIEAHKKVIFAVNEEENNFGAFDAVTIPTPAGFMETFIKRRVG
jgi:hypothetical protein